MKVKRKLLYNPLSFTTKSKRQVTFMARRLESDEEYAKRVYIETLKRVDKVLIKKLRITPTTAEAIRQFFSWLENEVKK